MRFSPTITSYSDLSLAACLLVACNAAICLAEPGTPQKQAPSPRGACAETPGSLGPVASERRLWHRKQPPPPPPPRPPHPGCRHPCRSEEKREARDEGDNECSSKLSFHEMPAEQFATLGLASLLSALGHCRQMHANVHNLETKTDTRMQAIPSAKIKTTTTTNHLPAPTNQPRH